MVNSSLSWPSKALNRCIFLVRFSKIVSKTFARKLKFQLQAIILQAKYPTIRFASDVSCQIEGELIAQKGVSIGRFSCINIAKNSKVFLGSNVWLNDNCHIETLPGQVICIGAGTTLQSRSQIRGDVMIGELVLIAPNVFISSGAHLYDYMPAMSIRKQDLKYLEDKNEYYSRPINIGNDCWLGINVVITPGTTIGQGCVVGANSVVTKNFPDNVVIGGTPAKLLKSRL
jgi:acetyltransferase-like isoleucine patch superfamily enzyme